MRQVEDILREAGALDDTPNLHGALFLDEFADGVEEGGGELHILLVKTEKE